MSVQTGSTLVRTLNGICAVFILLLALAHTFIAVYCRYLDEDGLWFLGSGIAILLAGLFNLLLYFSSTRLIAGFVLAVNIIITLLFALALNIIPQGQVYLGLILFVTAAIVVLIRLRRNGDSAKG
jgi:hypothetical protein